MQPLTKRQREILDYLNEFIQQHGYAPSLEDIGERFSFVGAWDDGERPEDGSIDGYEPYEPRFWMPLPEPPEQQP